MELRLERMQYLPGSTVGRLYVDGRFECYTLEDGIRTHKVIGETAIPAGAYSVVISYSPRFKRKLPLVCHVPNFEGVRIHPGNTPANTFGCILVGRQWEEGAETIGASKLAFESVHAKIADALGRGVQVVLRVLQENAPAALATRAVKPRRYKAVPPASKRRKPASKKPKSAIRQSTVKSAARKKSRTAVRRK